MSIQTTLSIDSNAVIELSRSKQEPEWMTALRTEGLALANSLELPTLEKTRIDRWSISSYGSYKSQAPLTSTRCFTRSCQRISEFRKLDRTTQLRYRVQPSIGGIETARRYFHRFGNSNSRSCGFGEAILHESCRSQ